MTLTTRTITNAGAPLYATNGVLVANTTITFSLVNPSGVRADTWDAATGERVGGDPIVVTTDAAGEFSVALWPNSRGSTATRYLCTVNSAGFSPFYGVVEDAAQPLPWVSFMASGTPLTPQEISQLTQYLGEIEAARDAAEDAAAQAEAARDAAEGAAAQAEDAADDAVSAHVASADPHTQYAKESDLGNAAGLNVGTTAGTVAAGDDARLSDPRAPTGDAGGVLSGSYPNPGFSVDMATQSELDAVASALTAHAGTGGASHANAIASGEAGFMTGADKSKLDGIATGATVNATDDQLRDRATHTGAQAISTVAGLQGELDAVNAAKVDKVAGKGLSTEDFTTAEKNKLSGIATGATANATDAQLRDRATHTGSQAISTVTGLQGALDAKAPLASPALTGVPSAPTAAVGTNTTQLATTAFSKAQIAADAAPAAHVGSGGAAHANAAASGAAGFMTGADKTKLDGIATGANNYTHPANHPPSIITQDASNRFVTDAEKTAWNAKEPAIAAGTTAQYLRGDKTWQPVADLPVSTAQAAAIATATAIHPFLLIGA